MKVRGVLGVGVLLLSSMFLSPLMAEAKLSPSGEKLLQSRSIVQGEDNSGNLRLEKEINRAEFMKILVKTVATTMPDPAVFHSCFPDVNKEWFASYVCWAKEQGYVRGFDDGLFHPEKSVTHAEVLKMINTAFHFGVDDNGNLSRPWYEGYYSAALRRNIISQDLKNNLAAHASRSDAFDQLSRALSLSELGKNRFDEGDLQRVPMEEESEMPLPPSEVKMAVMKAMENSIAYGMQPQQSKGSMATKFSYTIGETKIALSLNVQEETMVKGTSDTLEALSSHLVMQSTLSLSGMGENVEVDVKAEGDVLLDGVNFVYLQLDSFSLEDKGSSESNAYNIFVLKEMVAPYVGKWYKAPLPSGMQEAMKDGMNMEQMREELSYFMEKYGSFIDVSETKQEGTQNTYMITFDAGEFLKVFPKIMKEYAEKGSMKPVNKYEVKQFVKEMKPYVEKIMPNISLEFVVNGESEMMSAANTLISPFSLVIPSAVSGTGQAGNVVFELSADEAYTYSAGTDIVFPTDAEVIGE